MKKITGLSEKTLTKYGITCKAYDIDPKGTATRSGINKYDHEWWYWLDYDREELRRAKYGSSTTDKGLAIQAIIEGLGWLNWHK